MSDGPHKSLPMGRQWRQVAERVTNPLYTADEVYEALSAALRKDFREAPLSEVQAILGNEIQGSLFSDSRAAQLDALRQAQPGSAARNMLIDSAIAAVENGLTGDEAWHSALRGALEAQAWAGCRQIEEHQYREESHNGVKVRGRLGQLRQRFPYDTLASELVSSPKSSKNLRLSKKTGIDEGPPL